MTETASLTKPLIDALNKAGGYAIRMNSGKVRGATGWVMLHEPGTADIQYFPRAVTRKLPNETVIFARAPIWIETKTGKTNKEQRDNQEAFRVKVMALGHQYFRVTSVQEGLDAALRG